MANLRFNEDYHNSFDPKIYLEQFYKKLKADENEYGSAVPMIKVFHEFWSTFKAPKGTELTEVRYLEFGGGPSIANLIFACPKVDHIVFAEYAEVNREAVKSWIAGDPDAYDWMPLIEIAVLELEQGRGIVESPVLRKDKEKLDCVNRANELKRKIKSVIPCDVTKAPIVELGTDDVAKPFDVVSTSFCLESCVSSEVHFKNTVAELCKLLKPNGYLFMNGVLEQTFYFVGDEKFSVFPLTEKMVKEAMNEVGMEIAKFISTPILYSTERDDGKFIYYTYCKKSAARK
ncbi:nicotinamide N-methyltransferase-like [Paramuricea clavata]|uniref:Nicotinamide N-methyltransferase-like n=1 Tax=Paramuricea clavata TaxID=317549 RepID=A0A6S7IPK4_PARCT|nr:nicotinamide N-methyltransferase-like [Paramuricea clavata]